MTGEELKEYLEANTGISVELVITDNMRNMLTCRQSESEVLKVRAHHMFLNAGPKELRSLASFCKQPTKSNRGVIGAFIDDNKDSIKERRPIKMPVEKRVTQGKVHNLDEIFSRLNKKFFKYKCDAAYTWGRLPTRKRRRSIHFGNYNFETNTIRMHPALDRKYVPAYVVEMVMYHEMLHWYIPPVKKNGRNYVHTRLFHQAERLHPYYGKANHWKEKNLYRLLGAR